MDPAGVAVGEQPATCLRSRVSIPTRSQPDSAKTPGCRALNMASSRWACLDLLDLLGGQLGDVGEAERRRR